MASNNPSSSQLLAAKETFSLLQVRTDFELIWIASRFSNEMTFIAGHIPAVEHGSRLGLPGDLCEAVRERRQPGGPRNGGQGAPQAERRHQERGVSADLLTRNFFYKGWLIRDGF